MSQILSYIVVTRAAVFLYTSLDSEFLASTSTDGSARIWKTDGVPVTSLTRNSVCVMQSIYLILVASVILFCVHKPLLCLCRMRELNFAGFQKMGQDHFYLLLFREVYDNRGMTAQVITTSFHFLISSSLRRFLIIR